jgi:hypothetical protein
MYEHVRGLPGEGEQFYVVELARSPSGILDLGSSWHCHHAQKGAMMCIIHFLQWLACVSGDGRGEALLQRVESLAQAHAAHAQLFDLCEFLGDRGRLHDHMAASVLPHPFRHTFYCKPARMRTHRQTLPFWLKERALKTLSVLNQRFLDALLRSEGAEWSELRCRTRRGALLAYLGPKCLE